jgi:hypothetical protein
MSPHPIRAVTHDTVLNARVFCCLQKRRKKARTPTKST